MVNISGQVKEPPKEQKPLTKEEALAMLRSRMTHKTSFENSVIVLIGAWKNGKSVCAASVSDYFPEELPSPTMVELLDTYYFQIDPGGHDGFAELGFTLPWSDLSVPLETLKDYEKFFDDEIERIRPLVQAGIIKNVIFDSVSYYDDNIVAYLENNYRNSDEKYWGHLRQIHTDRFHKLRSPGCRLVVCVHPAENVIWGKEGSEVQQKSLKRQKIAMLGDNLDYKLSVTGKSAGIYKGAGSLILPVIKEVKKEPRKEPVESYWIHLDAASGLEGAARVGRTLEKKQPAHLRKLLDNIKAAQPKLEEEQ